MVIRGGRVLLALRPEGVHLELHWEFPGGKVEPGESLTACLHRELREELGTTVEILAPWKTVTHRYPEKRVTIHFFRCRLAGPEPRPLGCRELVWAAADELVRFRLPPADAEVAADLAALLAADA